MPYTVEVQVKTRTALHIGTQQSIQDVSHSPLRRSTDGQNLILPGTSIAGAIRSHLTRILPLMTALPENQRICCAISAYEPRAGDDPNLVNLIEDGILEEESKLACSCLICHLMGDVLPQNHRLDGRDEDEQAQFDELREGINGRASRLIVYDARIPLVETQIRDGVGINRLAGVAARSERAKFDVETIPPNVSFSLKFKLEADADEHDKMLLALALQELQAERIYFGGNTGRGMGGLMVEGIQSAGFDLNKKDDLMAYLRDDANATRAADDIQIHTPKRQHHTPLTAETYLHVAAVHSWLRIDFELQAEGFFLTNDITTAEREGFNHFSQNFLLGSSLRGALRSQAERIARTMTNLNAEVKDEAEFLARCPAADPLSSQASEEAQLHLESGVSRWKRRYPEDQPKFEQLNFFDLADQLWGNTYFGSRLKVEDALLVGQAIRKPLDFVAIDRFTGGAADQFKFDAYALWRPRFAARLYLENPADWELGWLLYLLTDVRDGLVPLGFGVAKGFGAVSVPTLDFTFGWAYSETFPHPATPKPLIEDYFNRANYSWADLPPDWVKDWGEAWQAKVDDYSNDNLPFDTTGNELYKPAFDYYWNDRKNDRNYHHPIYKLYKAKVQP